MVTGEPMLCLRSVRNNCTPLRASASGIRLDRYYLASRLSPLASCLLPLASRPSPLAPRLLPLASCRSPLASRLSPLTSHTNDR
ncbi:MAG: hypothetical protein C0183_22415 [Roseiflexus castenholzii]|nr:MAG: hypothetical protein C0183_22415 [Roseiflexus castenholzii]